MDAPRQQPPALSPAASNPPQRPLAASPSRRLRRTARVLVRARHRRRGGGGLEAAAVGPIRTHKGVCGEADASTPSPRSPLAPTPHGFPLQVREAAAAGYRLIAYEEMTPRVEKGVPVRGHLFTLGLVVWEAPVQGGATKEEL